MHFYITALDQQATQRDFSCELPLIEEGLDFLSSLVAKGHTLLSVYVVEDNHRTDLPIGAFDGLPFSAVIQVLQQEWQDVLSQPIPLNDTHKQELIVLTRRRIAQYQTILNAYERMIQHCTGWLARSQKGAGQEWQSFRQRYKQMLVTNQHQFAKAQFRFQLVTSRLNRLMA